MGLVPVPWFGVPYQKHTYIWTNIKSLADELNQCQCSKTNPCQKYKEHAQVKGNSDACTPFPRELCELIKRHVARAVSKRRFEPYCLPCA